VRQDGKTASKKMAEAKERGYQDLIAWKKAMSLARGVYNLMKGWPREEVWGLTSQIRRAVVSVPANIAEGHGRTGKQELLHHLSIAHGSLCEGETLLLLGRSFNFSPQREVDSTLEAANEVGRIIRGLMRSLR
jgi:four helix bundle protein